MCRRPLWAIFVLAAACAPTPSSSPETPPPMTPEPESPKPTSPARATPWSIVYADGSANVSRLAQHEPGGAIDFRYEPVTPERSSTGMYSGGDPRSERVAPEDPRVEALWREVERLEADEAVHVDARAKGTGALTITTPEGERAFIVKQGEALRELERILAGFGAT